MSNNEKGGITIGHLISTFIGAVVVTLIVGFTWGGWITGGTAEAMVQKSTEQAVADRLGKICMAQAQQSADIQIQLEELKKIASYNRAKAVMEKPWAIMPGEEAADREVAVACMAALIEA